MAKELFIGKTNNTAKKPSKILVGNSSNIAKEVKSIFVGNSSNKAVKVYPTFPDIYQKVEYILNTNKTQWIDTNVDPNSDTRILLEMEIVSAFTSGDIEFTGRKSASGTSVDLRFYANHGYTLYMIWDGNSGSFTPTLNTRYIFDWNRDRGSCYVNDTLLFTSTGTFTTQNLNFYLFTLNDNGSQSDFYSLEYRLYRFRAWQGNAMIRDMYPCYEKANTLNVGMYDVIGGRFYGNSGTGIFYKGPDVN